MNTKDLIHLVKSEIKPSMGCTEPVALGLAVSNTCRYLKNAPTKITAKISSNIFKNAFSVTIPNTTEAGIPLAITLGYLLAKDDNTMEIFSGVTSLLVEKAYALLEQDFVKTEIVSDTRFYIEVTASNETETAHTITADLHDNLIFAELNGEIQLDERTETADSSTAHSKILQYKIAELVEIAKTIELSELAFLSDVIAMNMTASTEGLKNEYGMKIGKTIKDLIADNTLPKDLYYHVKMTVAAASDMRMGGGAFSAMTVLGSGNQGFQTTLPTIAACQFLEKDQETLYRALFMAILLTIRMKYEVGRLSPICGATLSGTASAAVITWLLGGDISQMEGAMQTMFSNIFGMICDGAKDGCAMKLSTCSGEAVNAARLARANVTPCKLDGVVCEFVEDTIKNVARLSQEGMKDIDLNVIDIIMEKK